LFDSFFTLCSIIVEQDIGGDQQPHDAIAERFLQECFLIEPSLEVN